MGTFRTLSWLLLLQRLKYELEVIFNIAVKASPYKLTNLSEYLFGHKVDPAAQYIANSVF